MNIFLMLPSPLRRCHRRRHFWHATQDCVASYVDHIIHKILFWAISVASGSALYGAQPFDAWASSWSSPVFWRESRQDTLWHLRYHPYAECIQKRVKGACHFPVPLVVVHYCLTFWWSFHLSLNININTNILIRLSGPHYSLYTT